MARKQKLVVVGNGSAGVRTLEYLLEYAPDLYNITVFGSEPFGNYNRILLSPVLSNEMVFDDIVLHDMNWYKKNNIKLHVNKTITYIDRKQSKVFAADGSAAEYDRLILATGSKPIILPLPGTSLEGVIAYRDIADVEYMLQCAQKHRDAVVIGGGLLGLEAANGLKQQGMAVTVIHLDNVLMERQLDTTAAGYLQSELEQRGIRFLTGSVTASIKASVGGHRVQEVVLKDGTAVPADLVVMAVGIRPNIALAKEAGIAVDRGILVDDTLQTYDPKIYAVGECAQHRGVAYGLVAPLYEQAKVCASHLAGHGICAYNGSFLSTKLKVTGIDIFSAGDFEGGADSECLVFEDASSAVYKKIVLKNNCIIGALLYGGVQDSAWYLQLMRDEVDISAFRSSLIFGRSLSLGSQSASEISDAA